MFKQRLQGFLAAFLIGILSATPLSTHADDTDIYLSGTGGGQNAVRPNVLFVLDTSDSMNKLVDGTGLSRLENMRVAIVDLINSLDNVNVGFMRFNGHRNPNNPNPYYATGGPVIYPIANLDAANRDIPGEPDNDDISVAMRIAHASDDAEEGVGGAIDLSGNVLELGNDPGAQAQTIGPIAVNSNLHDARQAGVIGADNGSGVNTSSNGLQLARHNYVAVQFDGIPAIPATAEITDARLSFVAKADHANQAQVSIKAITTPDPLPNFSTASDSLKNYYDNGTAASVLWNIADWTLEEAYTTGTTTDNLKTLVQDLVDNHAWTGGSIGFVLKDLTTDDAQRRQAYSHDGDPNKAARLIITYNDTAVAAASTAQQVGLRFQDVQIPQGARITSAFLEFSLPDSTEVTPTNPDNDDLDPLNPDPFPSAYVPSRERQNGESANGVEQNRNGLLKIAVEGVTDAAEFTTTPGNITGRTWSPEINWDLDPDPTVPAGGNPDDPPVSVYPQYDDDYATIFDSDPPVSAYVKLVPNLDPDPAQPTLIPEPSTISTDDNEFNSAPDGDNLKDLVQGVVNQAGWCGGNAMALKVSGAPGSLASLATYAYEKDPSKAPILRVTYDQRSIPAGRGCIKRTYLFQTAHTKDDAYERPNGSPNLGGPIKMNRSATSRGSEVVVTGVHFNGVSIKQGATILSAEMEFNAQEDQSGAVDITIKGDASQSAARFENTLHNITDTTARPRTSASVLWRPLNVTVGDSFFTPELKNIAQEIVDNPDWDFNNSMAFYFTSSDTDYRVATSFDNNPFLSPKLRITVEEHVGDNDSGPKTVRQRLVEVTNEQVFTLNRTPSIETLYEAALYWRGDDVYFGKNRGGVPDTSGIRNDGMRYARVSHPGTYTGGDLEQPDGCDNEDLNALACKDERIDDDPQYISPFGTEECQANYMIFLSDGQPTQNGTLAAQAENVNRNLVEDLVGKTCVTNTVGKTDSGTCGNEILEYLFNEDQSDTEVGEQTVKTYTVGFNLGDDAAAVKFMKGLAVAGGTTEAGFYEAQTSSELSSDLKAIFTNILSKPSSFASPALAVSTFNKLFHRDEVYFSLFEPNLSTSWFGNIKKFKLCSKPVEQDCTLGEVLDADGLAAVDDASLQLLDTARSIWSAADDGPDIRKGGAGENMPGFASRKIYTDFDLSTGLLIADKPASNPDSVSMLKLDYSNHETILPLRRAACGAGSETVGNVNCDQLMAWILGEDVDDEDNDILTTQRWKIADPLHSSPSVITIGGSEAHPVDKLFVGTNSGELHMFNGYNGIEEWSFMPEEMMQNQANRRLRADGELIYGLDLTPTIHQFDNNEDGLIDPVDGDFVHVIIGMRRGEIAGSGRGNIYAIDATPTVKQDDGEADKSSVTSIVPKFLWRISSAIGDYTRLGQTWSQPKLTEIAYGASGTPKKVLIFSGGYDASMDTEHPVNTKTYLGNSIYVVDPVDGSVILEVSSSPGASNSITVTDMKYSIPADVTLIDSNGDKLTDRLYVSDIAGQVWRVDLGGTLTDSSLGNTVVGKLASLGDVDALADPADQRKFFGAISYTQVIDSEYSTTAEYDLIALSSGNRSDPLNKTVQDRIYAIRDFKTGTMTNGGSNIASDFPVNVDSALNPILNTHLENLTSNLVQKGDETALEDLKGSNGWYINLVGDGEKSFTRPIVLLNRMFVTTFLPDAIANPCAASAGTGRFYAINALTAGAVFENWGSSDNSLSDVIDANKGNSDRFTDLGEGILPGAIPVIQEEGITLLVDKKDIDPGITLPRIRTYWFEN